MINTNYIGMRFGGFEVVEYSLGIEKEIIQLRVKCSRCGEYKTIGLRYEKVLRIKCGKCGRMDAVVPINYYGKTKLVKDTVNIGEYRYRKLRTEYKKDNQGKTEVEFIRSCIIDRQ